MDKEKSEIKKLIGNLHSEKRSIRKLKYGGYLCFEHNIPFLIIYRNVPDDAQTIRLARTNASYLIIGKSHFYYFHKIVNLITQAMSERFGSYIIVELYSGPVDSKAFIIRGPTHKLSVSLQVLCSELQKIETPKNEDYALEAKTIHTKDRGNPSNKQFFSIEKIKSYGGTFIGLEIPPVYRNKEGESYPLYFKRFRDQFSEALHKAVLEFIRVQTSSDLKSYMALGKRKIDDDLFRIDKMLTEIENSYQFLLLVAPVNIQYVRKEFFKTNFNKVSAFHYRLLPIDPDLLKRRLYNLHIEQIDDPVLSFLFEEKREEIDLELSMLKDRDSKRFFYNSLRLYKSVSSKILKQAQSILENIPEEKNLPPKQMDAQSFARLAEQEFSYFHKQSSDFKSKIHIRNDVNVIMVSQGELYIPNDYTFTKKEASALIQHEVGTHILTFYNGCQQPLSQLSQGLAGYDSLQEGLAVLAEYLIGGLTGNRLRIIAGRVIAGDALLKGADFKEIFDLLYLSYAFSKEHAFNITSRIFQGGGFLKDIVYLKGLVKLMEYIRENGNIEFLLSGKFSLEHIHLIQDLTEREILKPALIKPKYIESKSFKKRLNALKNGLPLSQMAALDSL